MQDTPKAVVQINVSCGCGYAPKDLKEAVAHSAQSGHVLTMHGQIGPQERLSHMEVRRG